MTALAGAVRGAAAFAVAWLAGLPRRTGRRLFAGNDEEARWHGWQVTELAGGLARQYRDPRFDTLPDQSGPHGGRGERAEPDPRPWLGGSMPPAPARDGDR